MTTQPSPPHDPDRPATAFFQLPVLPELPALPCLGGEVGTGRKEPKEAADAAFGANPWPGVHSLAANDSPPTLSVISSIRRLICCFYRQPRLLPVRAQTAAKGEDIMFCDFDFVSRVVIFVNANRRVRENLTNADERAQMQLSYPSERHETGQNMAGNLF